MYENAELREGDAVDWTDEGIRNMLKTYGPRISQSSPAGILDGILFDSARLQLNVLKEKVQEPLYSNADREKVEEFIRRLGEAEGMLRERTGYALVALDLLSLDVTEFMRQKVGEVEGPFLKDYWQEFQEFFDEQHHQRIVRGFESEPDDFVSELADQLSGFLFEDRRQEHTAKDEMSFVPQLVFERGGFSGHFKITFQVQSRYQHEVLEDGELFVSLLGADGDPLQDAEHNPIRQPLQFTSADNNLAQAVFKNVAQDGPYRFVLTDEDGGLVSSVVPIGDPIKVSLKDNISKFRNDDSVLSELDKAANKRLDESGYEKHLYRLEDYLLEFVFMKKFGQGPSMMLSISLDGNIKSTHVFRYHLRSFKLEPALEALENHLAAEGELLTLTLLSQKPLDEKFQALVELKQRFPFWAKISGGGIFDLLEYELMRMSGREEISVKDLDKLIPVLPALKNLFESDFIVQSSFQTYYKGRIEKYLQVIRDRVENSWSDGAQKRIKLLNGVADVLDAMHEHGYLLMETSTAGEMSSETFKVDFVSEDLAEQKGAGRMISPAESSPAEDGLTRGGIDFTSPWLNLQIKRDGNGVPLPVNQQPLETMTIEGFVPVILQMTPVNLPLLLGLNEPEPGEQKDSASGSPSQLGLGPVDKIRAMSDDLSYRDKRRDPYNCHQSCLNYGSLPLVGRAREGGLSSNSVELHPHKNSKELGRPKHGGFGTSSPSTELQVGRLTLAAASLSCLDLFVKAVTPIKGEEYWPQLMSPERFIDDIV